MFFKVQMSPFLWKFPGSPHISTKIHYSQLIILMWHFQTVKRSLFIFCLVSLLWLKPQFYSTNSCSDYGILVETMDTMVIFEFYIQSSPVECFTNTLRISSCESFKRTGSEERLIHESLDYKQLNGFESDQPKQSDFCRLSELSHSL